ncbi:hypothetical protein [Nannocystis pusilla]|uniref:hypothetical protein n=1 Tax=Nannocystis pusilla TaxID=889268 RepID=UPI003B7D760E
MSVTIAENVRENIDNNELDKLNQFNDNPGYGGQQIMVKVAGVKLSIAHVTFGKGQAHVSIFYRRDGDEFQIFGVGKHDGKKDGKTLYEALWDGHGARRIAVQIQ